MLYTQKVFGRTVNKKYLVSETRTRFESQLNYCEVRKVDNGDDAADDDIVSMIIKKRTCLLIDTEISGD
jgi:hypothetical protein